MGGVEKMFPAWTPEMASMSASISHPAAAALACAAIMLVMWALKK